MKTSLLFIRQFILPYSFVFLLSLSCFISAHDIATIRIIPGSIIRPSPSTTGLGLRSWLRPKYHKRIVLTSEINSTMTGGTFLTSSNHEETSPILNRYISTGIRYPPRGGGAISLASSIISKNQTTMTSRQRHIINLLSGGVAGTLASCITNPLEVIKTQLQSSSASKAVTGDWAMTAGHPMAVAKCIYQAEGIPGFFRGLPPTLVGIIPSRSAYFYTYQQTKRGLDRWYKAIKSAEMSTGASSIKTNRKSEFLSHCLSEGSIGNALIAGYAAGVASNTLTNPIWMLKTRIQILADKAAGQRMYTGYVDAITTIWKQEGFTGFYRGLFASYWGCTEGAVQFLLYERIKTKFLNQNSQRQMQISYVIDGQNQQNNKGKLKGPSQRKSNNVDVTTTINSNTDASQQKLTKIQYFISAAIAKSFASVLTYPHEVARTRLREQARSGVFKYNGMWSTIRVIAREEGKSGLYAGMGVHLMKVVPNSAIMFLTYELVNTWLSQVHISD